MIFRSMTPEEYERRHMEREVLSLREFLIAALELAGAVCLWALIDWAWGWL